jgi:Domain of unknown function (DUF4281)
MNANQVFSLANSTALLAWIALILFPRAKWSARLVTGAVVPLLFAALYALLLALHWGETPGGFNSLAGVASLFANPWMLLAGWIHYLAFDLFIGNWEIRDAVRLHISYWLLLPCLILTFLFGPLGLLCYFVVRYVRTRSIVLDA